MKITINGNEHIFDHQMNITQLLAELALDPRKIAVEQNLAIVPCSEYEQTRISDGDKIEIVQFMGGG